MRLGLSELKRWRWRWLGLGYFLTVVTVSGYVLLALYTNIVGPEDTSGLSGIWLWFVNAPSSALSLLFYGATGAAVAVCAGLIQAAILFWVCWKADRNRASRNATQSGRISRE
jgi:hypothetical protein